MKGSTTTLGILAALVIGSVGGAWVAATAAANRAAINGAPTGAASAGAGSAKDAFAIEDALAMPNPLGDGPETVVAGKQLYVQMNCAGCHGYDGAGNMGPKLTDGYWRYGGSPRAIFITIRDGRPQGMPAWGRRLTPDKLWQLTAYVGSLGGGVPPGQAVAALHGDVVLDKETKAQDNAAEGGSALEGQ